MKASSIRTTTTLALALMIFIGSRAEEPTARSRAEIGDVIARLPEAARGLKSEGEPSTKPF